MAKKALLFFLVMLMLIPVVSTFAGGRRDDAEPGEIVLTWPCIWVGQDSKADQIARIVQDFNNKHRGEIRVVIEPQPDYDGYEDQIRTAMASRRVPDIFTFKLMPTTAVYYDEGILMDFTEDLKAGWGGNFMQANLKGSTIDGRIKSLPYEIAVTPVWYNQRLFDQAGIDEFPKTEAEFWTATEKLKNAGIVPMSHMTGGTNSWTSMLWYTHLVGSFGGPDIWEQSWDHPAYEQAAAVLKKMYKDGNTTRDAIGADAGVSGGHYLAERTAMFINGPWYIGVIRDNAPEVYKNTKLAPAPQFGDHYGHHTGWLHTNIGAAYTDDPARREAVLTFLKYLTNPENAKKVFLDAGSMLAINFDLGPEDEISHLQEKFMSNAERAAFLIDNLEAAKGSEVAYEFGQAIGEMVLGDASPAEFVEMLKAVDR